MFLYFCMENLLIVKKILYVLINNSMFLLYGFCFYIFMNWNKFIFFNDGLKIIINIYEKKKSLICWMEI